jgi:HK97 gp10 family phage protein
MSTRVTFKRNPYLGMELARQLAGVITQGGFVMERETKRRTPVDTGNLRNSFHTDVEVHGKTVHVEVGTNVEYAVYVEFGTSKMAGRHMLALGTQATARWLASKGFNIEYASGSGL